MGRAAHLHDHVVAAGLGQQPAHLLHAVDRGRPRHHHLDLLIPRRQHGTEEPAMQAHLHVVDENRHTHGHPRDQIETGTISGDCGDRDRLSHQGFARLTDDEERWSARRTLAWLVAVCGTFWAAVLIVAVVLWRLVT